MPNIHASALRDATNKKRTVRKTALKKAVVGVMRKKKTVKKAVVPKKTIPVLAIESEHETSFPELLKKVRRDLVHKSESIPVNKSPYILNLQDKKIQKSIDVIAATPRKRERLFSRFMGTFQNTSVSTRARLRRLAQSLFSKNGTVSSVVEKQLSEEILHPMRRDTGRYFRDVLALAQVKEEHSAIESLQRAHQDIQFNATSIMNPLSTSRRSQGTFWKRCTDVFTASLWHFPQLKYQAISILIIYIVVSSPLLAAAYYSRVQTTTARLSDQAQVAANQLSSADGDALNSVKASLGQLQLSLSSAHDDLDVLLTLVPPVGEQFTALTTIVDSATELLSNVDETLRALSELPESGSIVEKLQLLQTLLQKNQEPLNELSLQFSHLDIRILPSQYQSQFMRVQALVTTLTDAFSQLQQLLHLSLRILGTTEQKRYLVVFQNNYELRPSGGFMGSYALVDVYRGEIRNIEVPAGGLYDLQGQFSQKLISPPPLHLINPIWEPHDANWFADWPSSAANIEHFYYKSGGPSVDGVIALDTNVLHDILQLIGPVYLPNYDMTITADTFFDLIQNEVEYGADKKENKPKKIMGDLVFEVLSTLKSKTLDTKIYIDLLLTISDLLDKKDVLLYFNDAEIQSEISDFGWSGEIETTSRDYLSLVDINIGGGKTSAVIKQQVYHDISIADDGSITDTLTIHREHTGKKGNPLTGIRNVTYLKIYVPWKSVLHTATGFEKPASYLFEEAPFDYQYDETYLDTEKLVDIDSATGMDIYEEFGKTVFANWVQIEPGEEVTVQLTYTLPFTLAFSNNDTMDAGWLQFYNDKRNEETLSYTMLYQKQPGSWDTQYSIDVTTPSSWSVAWSYPDLKHVFSFENMPIEQDVFFGALYRQN